MGTPKALLPWQQQPLYLHLLSILQGVFPNVILSVSRHLTLPEVPLHCRVVLDSEDYAGPLQALLGIFPSMPKDARVFLCACDTPFLTAAHLRLILADDQPQYDALVPKDATTGLWQPLLGIYSTHCCDVFARASQSGQRSLQKCYDQLNVKAWDCRKWTVIDPQLNILRNLNTAEDYQTALSISRVDLT